MTTPDAEQARLLVQVALVVAVLAETGFAESSWS